MSVHTCGEVRQDTSGGWSGHIEGIVSADFNAATEDVVSVSRHFRHVTDERPPSGVTMFPDRPETHRPWSGTRSPTRDRGSPAPAPSIRRPSARICRPVSDDPRTPRAQSPGAATDDLPVPSDSFFSSRASRGGRHLPVVSEPVVLAPAPWRPGTDPMRLPKKAEARLLPQASSCPTPHTGGAMPAAARHARTSL